MTYQPNLHLASMVGPDLQTPIALKEVIDPFSNLVADT